MEYFDVPLDAALVKGILKNTIVSDELVVVVGLPVNFSDGYFAGVDHVDNLTIDGTWTELFYFGQIELFRIYDTWSKSLSHLRISPLETKYASSIIPMFSFWKLIF